MLDDLALKIADSLMDTLGKVLNDPMVIFGLLGQAVFMSRMVVQWIESERAKRSVIPIAFWYLSLIGSAMVLIYGFYKEDPVIIMGQLFGFIVYIRNLYLIRSHQSQQVQA